MAVGETTSVAEIMRQSDIQEPIIETPSVVETPVTEAVVAEPTPVVETPTSTETVDNNTSNVVIPDRFKTVAEMPTTEGASAAETDWKKVLAAISKDDVLKELGIDPFALQLDAHIKKGGSAEDYIRIKGTDYNKVPDNFLAKEALKADNPTLSEEDIDILYDDKYKQDVFATDDEKKRGAVYIKADAAKQRQRLIAEQQNFKIPEQPVVASQSQPTAEEWAKGEAKRVSDNITYLNTNDANIKSLNESKSLAVSLGEGIEPFKFSIDDPNVITRAIADVSFLSQLLSDDKGVLDTRAAQEMVMFAVNPENFKKSIFNYGKAAALKELVASGQNAGLPKTPSGGEGTPTLKEAFGKAKTVTLSSILGN